MPSRLPELVFHGTSSKEEFQSFDNSRQGQTAGVGGGFFFTNCEATARDVYGWRSEGRVLACSISVQRPLTLEAYCEMTGKDVREELEGGRHSPTNYFDNNDEAILAFAKSHGFDAVTFYDRSPDDGASDLYIVFDATQITIVDQNHRPASDRDGKAQRT